MVVKWHSVSFYIHAYLCHFTHNNTWSLFLPDFFLSHLERQFDVSTSIVHTFYCNVTLKQTPFGNENTLAAQHVKSLYASENNFLGLTASSENQTERQREV